MSKVRNRDGKAEMLLRKELWSLGLRYRLHSKILVGKPDIVFASKKLVVFVDGDFWHGRPLIEEGLMGLRRGIRSVRFDWWAAKIQRTVDRDKQVNNELANSGWKVMRYWESDVLRNPQFIASQIKQTISRKNTFD